jgi:hypothetical protein
MLAASVWCAIAFLLEDNTHEQDEMRLYMVKAGAFSCPMRLSQGAEFVLLQLPFVAGGIFMVIQIVSIVRHILNVTMAAQMHQPGESKAMHFLRCLKPVRLVLLLCFNVFMTLLLWALVSILSVPVFVAFLEDVNDWCVTFLLRKWCHRTTSFCNLLLLF